MTIETKWKHCGLLGVVETITTPAQAVAHQAQMGGQDSCIVTARLQTICQAIAEGLTGREIATKLGLQPGTVKQYRAMMHRLGVNGPRQMLWGLALILRRRDTTGKSVRAGLLDFVYEGTACPTCGGPHGEKREPLTPREQDLAHAIANCLEIKAIAAKLGLSAGTVKIYLHHIYRKGWTRPQLAAWAIAQYYPEETSPMMYVNSRFTVPAGPEISTACERCVYDRGEHADWCERRGVDADLVATLDAQVLPGSVDVEVQC